MTVLKINLGLILHLLRYGAVSLLMGAESLLAQSDSALEPKDLNAGYQAG